MSRLLALANWLSLPCRFFARLSGWLLLVLMAVILYDVIGRRYVDTGSFQLQELQWHLHGAIAMLCFGWAYINNAHVRIDLVSSRFHERTRMKLELLAIALFLLPFMAGLIWFGFDFAHRSFIRGEGSPGGIGLSHRWIIKSVIPFGAFLTLVGATSVFLRVLVALRRPDLLTDPWSARA
ncbi:TRAP transporter small permease subunit [Cereibacter sphaeroides]|nr:TRAP transporter small permease subunit [Cereibacter sphaeroides]